MAKKRKKGGKGMKYYGKASDGYDPSQSDPNWDTGLDDDSGGSLVGAHGVASTVATSPKGSGYRAKKPAPPKPSKPTPTRR